MRPASGQPAVSIITPVYNAVPHLPAAVTSVQTQTFEDWEWLITDDGSTDGSLDMLRQLAAQDSRIRVLRHPGGSNRGQAASRNLAMGAARGGLFAFLDADDAWTPGKLERDVEVFQRHPRAQLTYCRLLYWFSWHADPVRTDYEAHLGIETDTLIEPPRLLLHFLSHIALFECQFPAPSCVTIRRGAVPPNESLFEDSLSYYEDAVPLVRILLRHPAVVRPETDMLHRRGGLSFTSNLLNEDNDREFHGIATWIDGYLRASGSPHANAAIGRLALTRKELVRFRGSSMRHVALRRMMEAGRLFLPAAMRTWLWNAAGRRLWYR